MSKTRNQPETASPASNGEWTGHPISVPEPKRKKPPPGMHPARLVGVVDIGTHSYRFKDSKEERKVHQVVLIFELPKQMAVFDEKKGKEPFHQSNRYNISFDKKSNLYKDIVAWRGVQALPALKKDLRVLLGEVCMLNLAHEDKGNGVICVIKSITPLPEGIEVLPQITPSLCYSVQDGTDCEAYDRLPKWVRRLVDESEEAKGPTPSLSEIAERNVREATANAARQPHADEPEPEHNGTDDDGDSLEDRMNRDLAHAEEEGY